MLGTTLPPVTDELVERLEAPLEAFGVARVEALAELPGNPLGLRIERFGDVFAPAALAVPELDFVNRISCLAPPDAGRLDAILASYGQVGLRPWVEVRPGVELELPGGAALVGLQTVLYGPAHGAAELAVPVRETEDVAATARLILEAFHVPAELVEPHSAALARAAGRCGGRTYVVDLDGCPVAGAILTACDGIGYLAMAGTLPEYRGRGCQSALIARRISAAAGAGCELIVATAAFASTSQRNIEKAGLRVAYTKPVLRLTPAGAPTPAATA